MVENSIIALCIYLIYLIIRGILRYRKYIKQIMIMVDIHTDELVSINDKLLLIDKQIKTINANIANLDKQFKQFKNDNNLDKHNKKSAVQIMQQFKKNDRNLRRKR